MVYWAFEVAQAGDVLVIESRGCTTVAQWGDLTSMTAKGLGLGGAVMDGSLRDLAGIGDVGFPVFAQPWVVPNGALKDGPGEVNVPVAVGGVVVGDASGVVVVPREDAGKLIPAWLADTLRQKGCEIIDE